MLFREEVTNMQELINHILDGTNFDKFKVSVVCLLFDDEGKLILHRRGPGARDEIGKLLAIGGSFNNSDGTFRNAMKRELLEEAGNKANIELGDFIGCIVDSKVDNTNGELTNWAILGYKGKLVSGELVNMEPERCVGFEALEVDELLRGNDIGNTVRTFLEELR